MRSIGLGVAPQLRAPGLGVALTSRAMGGNASQPRAGIDNAAAVPPGPYQQEQFEEQQFEVRVQVQQSAPEQFEDRLLGQLWHDITRDQVARRASGSGLGPWASRTAGAWASRGDQVRQSEWFTMGTGIHEAMHSYDETMLALLYATVQSTNQPEQMNRMQRAAESRSRDDRGVRRTLPLRQGIVAAWGMIESSGQDGEDNDSGSGEDNDSDAPPLPFIEVD